MAQTEIILRAFNGQIDLRNAFQFSAAEILGFLNQVYVNPAIFGAAAQDTNEIRDLCETIVSLCEDGNQFRDPLLRPEQHVQRTLHPDWPSPFISKFKLHKSKFRDIDFWSLADMLGLLLSLFGPAPTGANKRNFYLPLTAMFAKWCKQLCIQKPPTVLQCTWSTAAGGEFYCLGANMSGYNIDKVETGSWLAVLNRARFSIISSERFSLTGWSQAWSPSIRRRGRARGKPFGRCAETYPMRLMLRDATNKGNIHGLALQALYLPAAYDDRLSGLIWRSTWDPCQNCQELITSMEGSVTNFDKTNGRQGAPP